MKRSWICSVMVALLSFAGSAAGSSPAGFEVPKPRPTSRPEEVMNAAFGWFSEDLGREHRRIENVVRLGGSPGAVQIRCAALVALRNELTCFAVQCCVIPVQNALRIGCQHGATHSHLATANTDVDSVDDTGTCGPAAAAAADNKPVKVFILAGQSNMEGHGYIAADPKRNGGKGSLEYLTKDKATADRFKHLLGKDGKWAVRDDVWVHYLDRKGKLTPGFGVKEDRIGPELGFGFVTGDAYDEPVLLIKLCWGGKSLGKDFRPPSSGGDIGPYYKEVINRTKSVLKDLKKEFPEFGDRGYELAGFGWHQGWNDRINQAFNDEYEKNMVNFIRDIRKDLGVKDLPFVIAETGMNGPEEKHPRALSLMKAQAAVAEHKEFKGNVAFVGTRAFWREKEVSPTGQGYHWNSNAETYYLIGEAMGVAMKKLCETRSAK